MSLRKAQRYPRGNQKQQIDKLTQWPKEKEKYDKQRILLKNIHATILFSTLVVS
jgi:hypothetical protein